MDSYPPGNEPNYTNPPGPDNQFPSPVTPPSGGLSGGPPSGSQLPPGISPGSTPNYGTPGTEPPKKTNKGLIASLGCVGCGILGCVGTIILFLVVVVGGSMWLVNNFISDKPLEMPPAELSSVEQTSLGIKLRNYDKERKKDPAKPVKFSLTDKELNYLFQESESKELKASIIITPENKIQFMASAPTAKGATDSFYNMSGVGEFSVENYKYNMKFDSLKIGNYEFPKGDFLKGFSEGMAENMNESPEMESVPFKIKTMKVEDGQINLELEDNSGATSPDSTPANEGE